MTLTTARPDGPRCQLDGWHGVIVASLVVKLFQMRPAGGFFTPVGSSGLVSLRNEFVAVGCHVALGMLVFTLTSLLVAGVRRRRLVTLLLHAAALAAAYVDLAVARFQGSFISSSQWALWHEGMRSVTTLRSFMAPSDLLLVIDLPIFAAALYGTFRLPTLLFPRRRVVAAACVAAVILGGAALHLWLRCGAPDVLARPYNRRYTHPVDWCLTALNGPLPRPVYPPPRGPAPSELAEQTRAPSSRLPHLVYVQIESLQGGTVEWRPNGVPVMPFLAEFVRQGRYFPNALSTRQSGISFDADIAVLTGFHPPPSSNPYAYAFHAPPYLPHLLRRVGYDTETWDNYLPEFYRGRDNHRAMGMQAYHALGERRWTTSLPRLSVDCPGDREFLTVAAQSLLAAERPTFAFIKTVSSHGPWDGLDEMPEVVASVGHPFSDLEQPMRGYAAVMRYVDDACREFFTALAPLLADGRCVVALYGDHGVSLPVPRSSIEGLSARRCGELNVPLLLVGASVPPGRVESVVSLQDLPRTMSDLVGLPFARGDLGGRNLLAPLPLAAMVTPWTVEEFGGAALLDYGYAKLGAPR